MEVQRLKDFYRGKTVLVTGHTGFKGSWLTHILLSFGAKVVGVSLPPNSDRDIFVRTGLASKVSHHEFDIRNAERLTALMTAEKPDLVFHLAAQPLVRRSYEEPLLTFTTNVAGTANVLEAIRLTPSVRSAVIITTDKVYENREWIYGYRENDPLGGYDPYSGSKAAADIVAEAYRRSFFHPDKYKDTHTTLIGIARAGNVIGGGDWSENRLVPDIMRAVFHDNGVVTLRNPGAVRPWEHVLEPLSGYLMLGMRLGEGDTEMSGSWNFGPDQSSWVSVGDLTEKMIKLLGKGFLAVTPDETKHESHELVLDTTKARRQLGWQSRWSFEKTVNETARWYADVESDPSSADRVTQEQIEDYFYFQKKKSMKVVILAGGLGTRIAEETHVRPKPMVEIGGMPILWHIMKIYSHYGFNDFIICTGYKGEFIKEWFSHYHLRQSDVTFNFENGDVEFHGATPEPWKVTLVDTGSETMTGGRLLRVRENIGNERFMMTYGDGVGNINIPELITQHEKNGKIATLTTVIPGGRFGVVEIDGNHGVVAFSEKTDNQKRVNAGFFVLEPKIFDYLKEGDATVFEQTPLKTLAHESQLTSYPHDGFWHPMDTLSDKHKLEAMWASEAPPWKLWK